MGETLNNDAIYVVVNQHVPESEKTLLWTLKNLSVKKIFLLNVHISLSPSSLGNTNVYQDSEWKTTCKSLEKYRDICTNNGIKKEDVDILVGQGAEINVIVEVIVELIRVNNIKKLVMAAAAEAHYSKGMSITSRKAKYVNRHAPRDCKIWFVCNGELIKTRTPKKLWKGSQEMPDVHQRPTPPPPENKALDLDFFITGCVILLAIVILLYETKRFIHFMEEFFYKIYTQLGINDYQFGFGFLTSVAVILLAVGLGTCFIKRMFN